MVLLGNRKKEILDIIKDGKYYVRIKIEMDNIDIDEDGNDCINGKRIEIISIMNVDNDRNKYINNYCIDLNELFGDDRYKFIELLDNRNDNSDIVDNFGNMLYDNKFDILDYFNDIRNEWVLDLNNIDFYNNSKILNMDIIDIGSLEFGSNR